MPKVDGKVLKKGFAKYQIVICYENSVLRWNGYKPDKHFVGSYVAWKTSCTRKRKVQPKPAITGDGEVDENDKKVEDQKKMLPSCNCRLKCHTKITETRREQINQMYWDKTYKERRTWILLNVSLNEPKRRTSLNENQPKKRLSTRKYQLDQQEV